MIKIKRPGSTDRSTDRAKSRREKSSGNLLNETLPNSSTSAASTSSSSSTKGRNPSPSPNILSILLFICIYYLLFRFLLIIIN